MTMRRIALTAPLALLVALALAGPASAEPGNGAQVVNESDCVTDANGTFCYDIKGVVNSTETASGNESYVFTSRSSTQFTGSGPFAGCNTSTSGETQVHYLVKDGTVHERSNQHGGNVTFQCGRVNVSCTVKNHWHYVSGQIQFSRSEYDCTTP